MTKNRTTIRQDLKERPFAFLIAAVLGGLHWSILFYLAGTLIRLDMAARGPSEAFTSIYHHLLWGSAIATSLTLICLLSSHYTNRS